MPIAESAVGQLVDLCQQMMVEYERRATGWTDVLQAQFSIFLVQLQRMVELDKKPSSLGTSERLVDRYLHLVDEHFRELYQVSDYAALLGVTPGHLTDTTRAGTGMSASAFIHRRRLLEAKRLLAYSEQTVAEIGFELNFRDPSYFSRFFRRECGISPTDFRQHTREKHQLSRSSALQQTPLVLLR